METTSHTTTNLNLPSADKGEMEWIVGVARYPEFSDSSARNPMFDWNLGFLGKFDRLEERTAANCKVPPAPTKNGERKG